MTIKELTLEFKKFQQETLENFNKMLGLINENNEEQKPKKELTIWKPKDGDKYYFINHYGNIEGTQYDDEDQFDTRNVGNGNAYSTIDDAQRFLLINKFSDLYRKYVEQHSGELCWNNFSQDKWYAYYDHRHDKIDISCDYEGKCQGIVYADTKQTIIDAIKFIGEKNMLRYVFEVDPNNDNENPIAF